MQLFYVELIEYKMHID